MHAVVSIRSNPLARGTGACALKEAMPRAPLETPVLLLGFNRPEATAENLRRILAAGPPRLYVALDGPRADRPDDVEACARVRAEVEPVAAHVELVTDFAARNLGLRPRVISALDWALEREPRIIVLEDDCHPAPSFFGFVDQMLARYAEDDRVGYVCGSTAVSFAKRGPAFPYDYHFSQAGLPWGWGTWRRAWRDMDREMSCWPELRRSGLLTHRIGPVAAAQWTRKLDYAAEYSSWYVRWLVTNWAHARLSVVPRVNLVQNVGVDDDATHTRPGTPYARFERMPVGELPDTLRHPEYFPVDHDLDQLTLEGLLPWSRVKRGLRQLAVEGPMGLLHHLR